MDNADGLLSSPQNLCFSFLLCFKVMKESAHFPANPEPILIQREIVDDADDPLRLGPIALNELHSRRGSRLSMDRAIQPSVSSHAGCTVSKDYGGYSFFFASFLIDISCKEQGDPL